MAMALPASQPGSRLAVVMFTDIAGSVEHKVRLGTPEYTRAARAHDALFREVVAGSGGVVLKDLGDGFMAMFDRASSAVEAAIRFQCGMDHDGPGAGGLRVRIGLALGEVTEITDQPDEPPKVIGLAADLAARMQAVALEGQVLLTRAAFDDARQFVRQLPEGVGVEDGELRWMAHGPFVVKGFEEPLEVFEVGVTGLSPLRPPPDNEKVRRAVKAGEEGIYDWRPAAGQRVPRREGWVLQGRLGEGGFGEVWVGEQQRTGAKRVFKFCFDADRLRSFKRELALFRVLREALGDRRDIARLFEVHFDSPPYFIESEYSSLGDLKTWADGIGGIGTLPVDERLEIVAKVADATAAAHSIGVLHKDIKPSNVLIEVEESGGRREVHPKLADFGIGILLDRSRVDGRGITATGLTMAQLEDNESSRTGTRMYSPPEGLSGAPFSVKGDIYALGVMLFQMAVGDLERPLAPGWERQIEDPVLREDIAQCVDGDPERRPNSAAELADRIRSLDERRAARRRAQRARRVRGASMAMAGLLGLAAVVLGVIAARERGLRLDVQRQKAVSDSLVAFLSEDLLGSDTARALGETARVVDVVDDAAAKFAVRSDQPPDAARAIHSVLALANARLGRPSQAIVEFQAARAIEGGSSGIDDRARLEFTMEYAESLWRQQQLEASRSELDGLLTESVRLFGENDRLTLAVMNQRANVLKYENRFDEAEQAYREVIARRTSALGADDRDTLLSRYNLALTLMRLKRYDEAFALYQDVLARQERAFGEDDPHALWTRTELATGQFRRVRETGDLTLLPEARAGLEDAVRRHQRISGVRHWRTLEASVNLATARGMMGDISEALLLYAETLGGYRDVRGPTHPHTVIVTERYARLLADNDRRDEACGLVRRALGELTEAAGVDPARIQAQRKLVSELGCDGPLPEP